MDSIEQIRDHLYITYKEIGVGSRWFRKWQFSNTLCTENVLTYGGRWFKKAAKHPYVINKCSQKLNLMTSSNLNVNKVADSS